MFGKFYQVPIIHLSRFVNDNNNNIVSTNIPSFDFIVGNYKIHHSLKITYDISHTKSEPFKLEYASISLKGSISSIVIIMEQNLMVCCFHIQFSVEFIAENRINQNLVEESE